MNSPPGALFGVKTRAVFAAVALLASGAAITGADPATFADVLKRAHQYVVLYEDHELSTVVAREDYRQQWLDATSKMKAERRLVSDYLLFQLPPNEDWFALRDVYEVDGTPLGDRTSRLKSLFSRPREQHAETAMEIMRESGRFNLATELYLRTVNVPTFGLRFLRPSSRSRMEFKPAGEEPIEDAMTRVIEYRETKGPTFVATPERRDLPAHGRFWVEPESGAVLRSEMIVGGTRQMPARVTITVTYKHEPTLGFRVPVEMLERYETPKRILEDDVVVGRATYSEFRPFDWRTLVPQPDQR
jgi:hypothetical protein